MLKIITGKLSVLNIEEVKLKNQKVGKSISSGFDDKFKSVYRILIASLYSSDDLDKSRK